MLVVNIFVGKQIVAFIYQKGFYRVLSFYEALMKNFCIKNLVYFTIEVVEGLGGIFESFWNIWKTLGSGKEGFWYI
jgi:hypothetical protein